LMGGVTHTNFWRKIKCGFVSLYVVALIPFIGIAPYIFPKADDFSFGYHAHIAWEKTGSLLEVIKAAFVMIEEAWFDWQGTYSSIFFMAVQPAVFDERLYGIVPFLFIGIITIASYFLIKTILVDWLKADKLLSQVCIWLYIFMVIQRMPDAQAAFVWYNGAIHYIMTHGVLLCAIAFTIRGILKRSPWSWLGACLCTIYVGGANYVTAVGSLLICLTVLFGILVTKTWKKYKGVIGICCVYFIAMAVNFIAPGNFNKKGSLKGYGIIQAFFMAFKESLEYMLGEWMHWSLIMLILLLVPVVWHIVSKIEYDFKYPVLVIGYSWCYMASLFFAPLFTLGEVEVGRFLNVMFLQWVLLLMFNIFYVTGWIQQKYDMKVSDVIGQKEKRYVWGICLASFLCFILCIKAEPQKYASVYAMNTWMDPQLEQYEEEYWAMVEVLNSDAREVEIKDFTYIPELFDVPLRHEGLCLYYDKENVIVNE